EVGLMISTSRFSSAAIVRGCACLIVIAAFSGLFAQRSIAALFVLSDDNSSAAFDTAVPANNFNWQVDGINQLNQQAFWFRIGNVAEQSLHLLPIAGQVATNTNFDPANDTLFVRYNGAGFQADVRYVLDGGAPGSGASDMTEQISITN